MPSRPASRICASQTTPLTLKVTQTLSQAGFVESLRGRGGGLRLGRPPASINLGAVVRATEDSFALVECFDRENNRCVISPATRKELEDWLVAKQQVDRMLTGHA